MSSFNFTNTLYLHAFNLLPQIGPARLSRLNAYFKSNFQTAFFAEKNELEKAGLEKTIIDLWLEKKQTINLELEEQNLHQHQITIISHLDKTYPKLLLEIPKYPPILYIKGNLPTANTICLAVVGTRKITNYGLAIIPDLLAPLISAGITIVSGMAFGVDSEAHKIALKHNAKTVAILGGGLDNESIYPKQHQFLAEEILEKNGCLISEYPPKTPNFKQNFIARNRIISGICLGTLIIECDLESGSLITAQYALEQNRQVYAVPGPIYSAESRGPNNLIKMGAKAVTIANDILEDLNLKNLNLEIDNQKIIGDNPLENQVLAILNKEPKIINEIIKLTNLNASQVTSTLTFLEMKGKVRNLGGQQYILSR